MSDEKINTVISFKEQDIGTEHVLTTIISPTNHKTVQITGDVDEAMRLAIKSEGIELTPAADRALLWKIDLYMMPIMCLLYCCQYMDKVTNSSAAILGLRKELHMVGDQYSWTGTAFYLGYLVFEFPSVLVLQKLPVAKTVGVLVMLWGMILALHSVPQYPGFIALRTILGSMESAVTPAFVIITGQWYKKEEQFIRTSIWFSFNGLGTIFGSGIAYGLLVHKDSFSIEAWKLVFIITGCITVFVGFLILIHIPDSPSNAWFLSEHEKLMVVERIRSNQQGFGNKTFKKHQFIEALLDVHTWLLFIFALATDIPNGGMTNFATILLNTDFKYTAKKSLLMNMPQGAIELVGCTLFGYLAKYAIKHRMASAIFATAIVLMGSCLLAFAHEKKAQLAGLFLFGLSPVGFICLLSCVSSNVAGHTKKVTVNAIYLIGYCVGNVVGPQTFISKQAPTYTGAKVAIVVCYVVAISCLCGIYFLYWKRNLKLNSLEKEQYDQMDNIENVEFADLTDKENPNFRYAL